MDRVELAGVELHAQLSFPSQQGAVLRGLRIDDPGFSGFGETYFSIINPGAFKPWRRHQRMTCNLIVPCGAVLVAVWDESSAAYISLSTEPYQRLTIQPKIWFALAGLGPQTNLLCNVADMCHDPEESETRPLDTPGFPLINLKTGGSK